MTTELES